MDKDNKRYVIRVDSKVRKEFWNFCFVYIVRYFCLLLIFIYIAGTIK